MGVLDSIVTDTGSQLKLSNSSVGAVLSGLLSFINQDAGGVGALLDRFRRAGAGNLVTSWLGGNAASLNVDAVETALGHDTVNRIASKAGLSFSTAASAIALMLPALVQRLAPGGAIPARLSSDVTSYLAGPTSAMASGARQAAYAAETVVGPRGMGRYLWPLLALLLVGLLGIWLASRGTSVTNVAFNAVDEVRLATGRATAALSALRPGFSLADLVGALNLDIINFSTGSAQIPAESQDFLNRSAVAFKAATPGTVIEIGGHTDKTGDSAANLQLSQQRADAVRDYLVQQGVNPSMLVAKGYGDARPIASNDTEEGRFRNRRIEFALR